MKDHEINTPLRAAAFMAQIAHESAELRFMQELWGPTCAYRKSHPTFRRLHLQELSIDTTNWHSEFSFSGPASFI
jgi:predicted chitinase